MTTNQIAYWNLQETNRANLAKEFENNRSNVARETETNRSNLVNEAETRRHNTEGEKLTKRGQNVQLGAAAIKAGGRLIEHFTPSKDNTISTVARLIKI